MSLGPLVLLGDLSGKKSGSLRRFARFLSDGITALWLVKLDTLDLPKAAELLVSVDTAMIALEWSA